MTERRRFLSTAGEFMGRAFEMVLDIPRRTARAWSLAALDNPDVEIEQTLDARLSKALDTLPRAVRMESDAVASANSPQIIGADAAACSTRVCLDDKGVLAKAGLRVEITTVAEGRRAQVQVYRDEPYSPGVIARETLFQAELEGEASVESALVDAPEPVRHALKRAGHLAPTATLNYERRGWQWHHADGMVVDIFFDRFTAQTDSERPSQRELRLSVAYADETEDAEGTAARALAALFEAARELVAALPAFPVLHATFDRATDSTATSGAPSTPTPAYATSIDLTGISTPHAALIAIGNNLAQHWFGNDVGVRDAVSTEFVHQMRVAQRRVKTALRLFPHWANEAWKTRVAPDLKWLGEVLGEARDWDVFVDTTLPGLAAADIDSAAWKTIRERADARRLEARERIRSAMGSARYAGLALAWLEWLSGLPSSEPLSGAAGRSLRAYAGKRVNRYYKRLADAPKLATLDQTARHKERIHAKYLRYALEFFESIASKKTRSQSVKTVSRMQSVLGDGNDAVVALRHLEQIEPSLYQLGFAHGWCEASQRYAAQHGERLLRRLRKPKISGGAAG